MFSTKCLLMFYLLNLEVALQQALVMRYLDVRPRATPKTFVSVAMTTDVS